MSEDYDFYYQPLCELPFDDLPSCLVNFPMKFLKQNSQHARGGVEAEIMMRILPS